MELPFINTNGHARWYFALRINEIFIVYPLNILII